VIREDPERPGLLYLGTENGLYVSFDDGGNWTRLRNNLPPAPVYWLTIQEHFSDLVVGTYGRGFWILDDITPIRQLDDAVLDADAHLFAPRAAYRFASVQQMSSVRSDADGFNPTYGASINYHLKDVPDGDVTIDVLDGTTVIRTLTGTKNQGINRLHWDLRHESLDPAQIRTAPLGHPEPLPEYLQYNDEGWRPMGGIDGPLVVPGTFTIRLRVGDTEQVQPLEVRKDPNTEGTVTDIREQNRVLFQVRELVADQNEMINALEWVRKQIEGLRQMTDDAEALEAADDLYQTVLDIEGNFFQLTVTGRGDDGLRAPGGLPFNRLTAHLASADFKPTSQAYEVYEEFVGEMEGYREGFTEVVGARLRQFNTLVEGKGLPPILIP
jgi:hypothetical protein